MLVQMQFVADRAHFYYSTAARRLYELHGTRFLDVSRKHLSGCQTLAARDVNEAVLAGNSENHVLSFDLYLVFFARRMKVDILDNHSIMPLFYGYLSRRDYLAVGTGMNIRDRVGGDLRLVAQKLDDLVINEPFEACSIIETILVDFPFEQK